MPILLRACLLFIILAFMALTLGIAAGSPLPVSLQLGNLNIQTSAPVAVILLLIVLLATFYLGRFAGWLARLPGQFRSHRKASAAEHLADAYAAYFLADDAATARHLTAASTETPVMADLTALLGLQANPLPTNTSKYLENPRLAPLAALRLARQAAGQNEWAEVRRLTSIGRQYAPQNLPLQILQFKALVNLNDPMASDLLPAFKTVLGAERHKLLTSILQGPTALTARPVLDAPWVKAVQQWLTNTSDAFPA